MDDDFIPLDDTPKAVTDVKKTREPREPKGASTLFVSSLPYNATSTDLTTHFSFIGPVRHGFVATDRESGKSKGVGYVTYAMKEDAERAVTELNNSEFGAKGRKIRVVWADRKPGREILDARPAKKARVAAGDAEEAAGDADPNAIRTLIVTALPADLTKAVLWKKIRKVNGGAEITYPIEGEEATAHVVFPTHGEAVQAIPKLQGHTYKGSLLSAVLKKRLAILSSKGEGKAPSHAGRLIVRNLAWETTEADLRATFLPFGPIQAIDLPTLPSKLPPSNDPSKPNPPPRARGFAFVWFMAKKDAEKAMAAINGKPIKQAPNAAVAKGKQGRLARKGEVGDGRPVAVDWAMSKEKYEGAKKKEAEEESGSESESSDSDSGSDSESDSDSDSDDSSKSGSGSDSDSDDEEAEEEAEEEDEDEVAAGVDMEDGSDSDNSEEGSDEEMDEDDEEEEAPIKPKLPDTDVGSTLFMRNVPYEATEQELGTLFRSFGPIRYAKVTMDKATGRSRGTGFVCFWNKEHADAAIAEAERVALETGTAAPAGEARKNPFALPSVLTADPSSSLASRLVLHGRTINVSRAVTRETAGHLAEDNQRAREKGDKRNTYLMREGVVFPNSPAAAALPASEIEKRQAAFNARKALLRSNPSLYISKTRLSVRQLPLFVTDRGLKRLGIHAVRMFNDEMKAGTREGLTRIEADDDTLSPALEGKKPKRGERVTSVVQSKVVRQNEKIDPLTGKGRSKGYGFLEFRSHQEALKAIRWANNNPAVGPLLWEWWTAELEDLRDRARKDLAAVKAGKPGKETAEELEARLKKLEARVAEGDERAAGGMRQGKTLLIEFSIENVQVVRRRVEKVSGGARDRNAGDKSGEKSGFKRKADDGEREDRSGGDKRQRRDGDRRESRGGDRRESRRESSGSKGKFGKDRPDKRDRAPRDNNPKPEPKKEAEPRGIEKLGNHLGSLIGRKRKARRAGK